MLLFSPKFTNFVTISDKNNSDSLYFHKKVHKKILELLKVTQNSPSTWLNVVPSLKKPCSHAGSEEYKWAANLQPTLNKGRGGSSLTIFFTDCSLILSQQKAYIKNRFIGEAGRTISDIMQVCLRENIEGLLVTMGI